MTDPMACVRHSLIVVCNHIYMTNRGHITFIRQKYTVEVRVSSAQSDFPLFLGVKVIFISSGAYEEKRQSSDQVIPI